jgi:signal transduction histidine kinase
VTGNLLVTAKSWRFFNIRNKIIVPYLVITILVAAIGTYIVTRLVASSLQERLSNQLIESSYVATESFSRQEQKHLETLRLMTQASGMSEAIVGADNAFIQAVVEALSRSSNIPDVAVLDSSGNPLLQRGSFAISNPSYSNLASVQAALAGEDKTGDKYSQLTYTLNPPQLILVGPVRDNEDEIVGAVVVGTPLEQVIPSIKQESLSDLILYTPDGAVLDSTFFLTAAERSHLTLDQEQIQTHLATLREAQETPSFEIEVNGRRYQGVYTSVSLRNEPVALMTVYLPSDFIVLEGGTSARIFSALFATAAFFIILIGLAIAAHIVNPIQKLVVVLQRVTAGDLSQRTQLQRRDEVGFLGLTFNLMTTQLEERTRQLEITIDALKSEAARLNTILANSQTGMVMFDPSGKLSFMNQAASRFLKGETVSSDLIRQAAKGRLEIDSFVLATQATTVLNDEGEALGTLVALNDITREEVANRLKDRFIARVSHELRTPLTAIKGFSDLIDATMELGKPPKPDHVKAITEQTMLLDGMIVQLLAISQMSAGTFTIRPDVMDCGEMLRVVIDGKMSAIQAASVALQLEAPNAAYKIKGDSLRLSWAVANLFDNALKYTLPGGSILCKLFFNENQQLKLIVQDTGIGIRPADLPYIFDAYYRGEAYTLAGEVIDPRGLGLGLYMVRSIIEAHKGTIHVQSEVGVGSMFTITLPVP